MKKYTLDQFKDQMIDSFEYYYPNKVGGEVYNDDLMAKTFANSPGVVFLCDFKLIPTTN